MTDAELLGQYVEADSHDAFTHIVARHAPWVHGVARRRVRDEHLAQDVTQGVFMLLAERAGSIRDRRRLSAWLMRATHYAGNHAIRAESRRRKHERRAALDRRESMVESAPADFASIYAALDQAVARLRNADREIVTRRFYRGQSIDGIAGDLGINAEAARKRITRALDKLRAHLGSKISPNDLAGLFAGIPSLSQLSSQPAAEVAGRALSQAGPSRAGAICKGASQMILRAKIRAASILIGVALAGGAGAAWALDKNVFTPTPQQAKASASTSLTGRTIMGSNIFLSVSPDGKKLAGYSKNTGQWAVVDGEGFDPGNVIVGSAVGVHTGKEAVYGFAWITGTWAKAEIPPELRRDAMPQVYVGTKVAAFAIPGAMFGFSTETGTWDMVRVPSSATPEVAVGADYVSCETNGHFYVFSLKTGKWTTPF
jgi:RNA polymerase sigma factor (sigma-70 family)